MSQRRFSSRLFHHHSCHGDKVTTYRHRRELLPPGGKAGLLGAHAQVPLGGPPAAPRALAAAPGPAPGHPDTAAGRCRPPAKCSPFATRSASSPARQSSILRGLLRSSGLSGVFVVPRSPLQGRAPDWTHKGPPGRCRPARRRGAAGLRAGGGPQAVLACWQTPRRRVGWGSLGVMAAGGRSLTRPAHTVTAAALVCRTLGDGPASPPGS